MLIVGGALALVLIIIVVAVAVVLVERKNAREKRMAKVRSLDICDSLHFFLLFSSSYFSFIHSFMYGILF